jgi:thiamine biosynthesis lipoprotein
MSDRVTVRFSAIGTQWRIDTERPLEPDTHGELAALIDGFDRTFSRFRDDTLVTRMARSTPGGRFEFPAPAAGLFDLYDRLVDVSHGAVDPLIGRRLELLGYDATYGLRPAANRELNDERAQPARWRADVDRHGTTLTTRRPVVLDVGAAGKGYLVDLVAELLVSHGHDAYVVDAGGDLRHRGDTPLRVGLEHPGDPQRVVGVVRCAAQPCARQPATVGRGATACITSSTPAPDSPCATSSQPG